MPCSPGEVLPLSPIRLPLPTSPTPVSWRPSPLKDHLDLPLPLIREPRYCELETPPSSWMPAPALRTMSELRTVTCRERRSCIPALRLPVEVSLVNVIRAERSTQTPCRVDLVTVNPSKARSCLVITLIAERRPVASITTPAPPVQRIGARSEPERRGVTGPR